MNRADLQQLAEVRTKEAGALLQASLHDGAYYLAGYAVECALKACIAKKTREHDFPDKRLVNESHTHDLVKLIRVAELELELKQRMEADPAFEVNWAVVKDWSEEARYQRHPELMARDYYNAVVDAQRGILTWLREHW